MKRRHRRRFRRRRQREAALKGYLKLVNNFWSTTAEAEARFLREVEAIAQFHNYMTMPADPNAVADFKRARDGSDRVIFIPEGIKFNQIVPIPDPFSMTRKELSLGEHNYPG